MKVDYENIKTICVIGLSNNSSRTAYAISQKLLEEGFRIIPVNPRGESVFGEKGYISISEIPKEIKIDLANFFLRAEKVMPLVREALERGIKLIWLQKGVISHEAARLAKEHGADIIMDECFHVKYMEHKFSHCMGRSGLSEL